MRIHVQEEIQVGFQIQALITTMMVAKMLQKMMTMMMTQLLIPWITVNFQVTQVSIHTLELESYGLLEAGTWKPRGVPMLPMTMIQMGVMTCLKM